MPSHHVYAEQYGHHSPHDRDSSADPLNGTWKVTQAGELECDHCLTDGQPNRQRDQLTTGEGHAPLVTRVAVSSIHSLTKLTLVALRRVRGSTIVRLRPPMPEMANEPRDSGQGRYDGPGIK